MRRAGRSHRNLTHVSLGHNPSCSSYLVMPMRYDLLFFLTICEVAWPTLEAHRQGKPNYKALVCNANQSRAWVTPSLLSAA